MPLSGYATAEGTERFSERATNSKPIADNHFRTDFQRLSLSSLGMGSYLGQPTAEDDALMSAAVIKSVMSGSINVIDTAINYRHMHSERAIGEALNTLINEKGIQRDELFIASKNGFLTPDPASDIDFKTYFTQTFLESGKLTIDDIAGGMHCMHPEFLKHQLDVSLANLGLETLDLMYLHNASESQLPSLGKEAFLFNLKRAFEAYEEARQEGKLRYYGMATWNSFRVEPTHPEYVSLEDVVSLAIEVGGEDHGFRYIQLPFNLAFTEALTNNDQPIGPTKLSTFECAMALNLGVFTSVPLLQGQLLSQDALPSFENISLPAQKCLQFIRSTPGVVAPLVGHKQPAHVDENLGVAKINPLSFQEMQAFLKPAK